ncbi:MAG: alpha/beta fold hydrolase [Proteobacteria bacterium]|nr:alpha/beta fold hydrolase [Pseudomonadota bacterium]
MDRDENDLSIFDQHHVLQIMFYPRRDPPGTPSTSNAEVHFVEVEEGISISCRFYMVDADSPNILFFHGNGEIASDYDGIAPYYNQRRINLCVADYRGYGMSGGSPTATSMIRDAHEILQGFKEILRGRKAKGHLFLMGRSLGSASAIELACYYQGEVKGLIVESGFADALALLSRFGVSIKGATEEIGSFNLKKIRTISIPTLIIHSQYDHIIPLNEGVQLHNVSGAREKELVIIPNANHNDLMIVGMDQYLEAIEKFVFAT